MITLLSLMISCSTTTEKISDSEMEDTTQAEASSETTDDCPPDEDFFSAKISPILESKCVMCHSENGLAAETRLVLTSGDEEANLDTLLQVATIQEPDGYLLMRKPTNQHEQGHVGGEVLSPTSEAANDMALFIGRANDLITDCDTEIDLTEAEIDCSTAASGARVLRRLSHIEYDNTISDLFGIDSMWGDSFAPDNVIHGYNNSAEGLQVSSLLADQYMNAAEDIASEVVFSNLDAIVPCDFVNRNLNCAEDFLLDYGTKIFRRPLNNAEMESYLGFFAEIYYEDGFNEAIKWTLAGLLQSPHFLYRSELGIADGNGNFNLTSWEIATELSYLMWQTTPDDTLLAMAQADELTDRTVVMDTVQTMISDPRAAQTVVAMTEQWFSLNLLPIVPREGDYEVLTDDIRDAMEMEINKFMFNAFADNITFADLLTANHSYMNPTLADYYGVELGDGQPDGDGFSVVDLSGNEQYGGLLTQGAILTVHALPVSSSPVHRGVLVREKLLCQELPPPPANLDTSPPAMDPSLSTRERYEAHVADPACSGCHNLIDGIGFGFEHYDGIGRWRELDGEHQVDASGVIMGGDTDLPFHGVQELSSLLSADPVVDQCYVQQWYTYGFGEGHIENPAVACGVEQATTYYQDDGSKIQSPIVSLTQIDRFYKRTGSMAQGSTLAVPSDYLETDPVDTQDPGGESGDLSVHVHEFDNWGSGYCSTVTVTNISTENVFWEVTIEVPGNLGTPWNATIVSYGNGDDVTFAGVSWNAELAPGGAAEFGFCAEL